MDFALTDRRREYRSTFVFGHHDHEGHAEVERALEPMCLRAAYEDRVVSTDGAPVAP